MTKRYLMLRFLKRFFELLFLLSAVITIASFFYHPPLPRRYEIVHDILENEPVQETTAFTPFQLQIKDFTYRIEPKFTYELYGLIVTQYDSNNWLDYTHREDPGNIKDVCVVWGKNVITNLWFPRWELDTLAFRRDLSGQ